jgi:DNA-binding beta-propeller fold protein YncE
MEANRDSGFSTSPRLPAIRLPAIRLVTIRRANHRLGTLVGFCRSFGTGLIAAAVAIGGGNAWATSTPDKAAPVLVTAKRVIAVGTRPESITRGFGGKYYVTVMNTPGPGDGVVKVVDGDAAKDFASGLDEPKGICFTGKALMATDLKRVVQIDEKGQTTVLADAKDFPSEPSYLNDIACEPGGKAVYVADMGANTKIFTPDKQLWPLDSDNAKALPAIGRVYRIGLDRKITVAVDNTAQMPCPNGVSVPKRGRLLIAEFFNGNIFRPEGKDLVLLASGLRGADGIQEDARGNVYVSSWTQGKVWRLPRTAGKTPAEPVLIAEGFQSAADFFIDTKSKEIFLPDMKAGTVSVLPLP